MKPFRILVACLTGALVSTAAHAVILPVAQDNSSTPAGTFSAATGKATSLAVAPNRTAYVKFDLSKLPSSVTVNSLRSARLILYTTKLATAGDLSVSDVTSAWDETSAGAAAPVGASIATIPGSQLKTKRFAVVDVTTEVASWLSGSENDGMAISSSSATLTLGSKEGASTGFPAELEIDFDPTIAASGNTALSGSVGIGTSTPSQLFEVASTRGQFDVHPYFDPLDSTVLLGAFLSKDDNGPQMRFGRASDFIDIGQNGNGAFVIENLYDTALLTVAQDGAVNVGSGNGGRLNVNAGPYGNTTSAMRARPSDLYLAYYEDENGNFVGGWVNATNPSITLYSGGDAAKPGGGSWAVSSDVRLKKNIESVSGALDRLLQLRSVSYEYKDPASIHELPGRHVGFVAQEVEKVFPDWVGEKQNGMKFVAPKGFESLTVAALRELRAEKDEQIKTLAAENAELKKRLDELEARDSARLARLTALEKSLSALVAQRTESAPARAVSDKSE